MSQFKKYLEIIQEGKLSAIELKNTKGIVVLVYGENVYSSDKPLSTEDTIKEAVSKFRSSLDNNFDALVINYNNALLLAAKKEKVKPSELNFAKYHAQFEIVGSKGMGLFQYKKI
jgi:hypothetical protein